MRTSEEIYHRVRWDARFDPARFVVGINQRGAAPKRMPLAAFVPGGDIPWHRVLFFEADGEVVWDRATGADRIDATDAGRVRSPRRLRAPFFTARTPYAWKRDGWVPATAPGSVPTAAGLRVLTWNTLWDRYDSDRIDTAARRPLLLAALREADADVIALQEVEPKLAALLMAEPWVRDGWTLGTDPLGRDIADHGLLLLSRLPVREAGHHGLGPHKAVTALVVETATGPVVVAATHLSSDHSADGAGRRRGRARPARRRAGGRGGRRGPGRRLQRGRERAADGARDAGRLERCARSRGPDTHLRPGRQSAGGRLVALGTRVPAGPGAAADAGPASGLRRAPRGHPGRGRTVRLRPLRRRRGSGSARRRAPGRARRPADAPYGGGLDPAAGPLAARAGDPCGARPSDPPLAAAREPALRVRAGGRLRTGRSRAVRRGRRDRSLRRPPRRGAQLRAPGGRDRVAGPGGRGRGAVGTAAEHAGDVLSALPGPSRGVHPASEPGPDTRSARPRGRVRGTPRRDAGEGRGAGAALAAGRRADAGAGDRRAGDGRDALDRRGPGPGPARSPGRRRSPPGEPCSGSRTPSPTASSTWSAHGAWAARCPAPIWTWWPRCPAPPIRPRYGPGWRPRCRKPPGCAR